MRVLLVNVLKIFIIFILISSAYCEETEPDSRDDMKTYHAYDDVDMTSVQKITYGVPRVVVRAVYPQLQSDTPSTAVDNFNQRVLEVVQDEISSFQNLMPNYKDKHKKIKRSKLRNDLFIDYDSAVVQIKRRHIISVRFSIKGIIAGTKQPYRYHSVLNYDLNDDHELALNDLFKTDTNYLDRLSTYVQDILYKRLQNKKNIMYETSPYEVNYKNWNLKPSGLVFTFDKVSNHIIGAQTVVVPYSFLKEMINEASPLSNCITRKNCVRNNLLTGGFIDEALNKKKMPLFASRR